MDATFVFDLIESIVSICSLVVSISVFLNTIRKTNKERALEASKERYYALLKKIDELFRKIDPEVYYDELSEIYGDKPYSYPDKYTKIRHEIRDTHYLFQEILLHKPNNGEVVKIVEKLLDNLEKKAIEVNLAFCHDIELLNDNRSPEINVDFITNLLSNYEKRFLKAQEFIFEGLSFIQKIIFDEKVNVAEYKLKFEENFKDEI